jgi:hypothetical protein
MFRAGRLFRRLSRFSLRELALLPVLILLLAVARGLTLWVAFARYEPILGHRKPLDAPRAPEVSAERQARAAGFGRLTATVARAVPWRAMCLEQALAVAILLRAARLPARACLGLRREDDGVPTSLLQAHAWVEVGTTVVAGGPNHVDYTTVAVFQRP